MILVLFCSAFDALYFYFFERLVESGFFLTQNISFVTTTYIPCAGYSRVNVFFWTNNKISFVVTNVFVFCSDEDRLVHCSEHGIDSIMRHTYMFMKLVCLTWFHGTVHTT